MSLVEETAYLDATAQAEMVRRGEVKPAELVEAAIRRVEKVNPQLNAVVTPLFERALEEAKGELPQGPFTGVPFLLKDLLASYRGARMTFGSDFFRDYVPDFDSELVVRLKRAGLVIIGKTNTPEFGILPTTEPRLFGPARNPWDTGRSTGGSSGGSAAAVASGMVPAAHANDGGGSIRIPASCCGLFGLKPTRARNPLGPAMGDIISGLVVEHAVTRSVRDSAALLDATSGPDIGDPYWAPPPSRPFLQEVGADPGRLRIAYTTGEGETEVHADCVKAVEDAARLCAELGHEVEEKPLGLDVAAITPHFMTLWGAAQAWMADGMAGAVGKTPAPEMFEPLTWALIEMGRGFSAAQYLIALTALQGVARDFARRFREYDLILTPTVAEPPPPLGTFDSPPDNPLYGIVRAAAFVPFTPICNITGQPAMNVPLYWNEEGLPVGVHFMARFGDEATLFRLAAQLEEARPWAGRRPPVSAG
ncbi:amidase [Candidatus Solincola tengchongensis]|uniref:amidase n=1 Tax=Candidatus Solincola tengchongensis TaxID=2900693 RepID=UPI002580698B|nr:amidase [Candidatus Solincola tengchongensis]